MYFQHILGDKHSTYKKRIIVRKRQTQASCDSHPLPRRFNQHTQLNRFALRQEIVRRSNKGHSFQRIASELRITYVEVVRIAGGLS